MKLLASLREIASRFAHSWPTTTRHLKVLTDAELVRVVRRGRERFYQLNRERLKRVVGDWLDWFDRPGSVEKEPGSTER